MKWLPRAAIAVFLVHFTLLFFPPIPPLLKGSVLSFVLGHTFAFLAAWSVARHGRTVRDWWYRCSAIRQGMIGAATAGVLVFLFLAVQERFPDVAFRYGREEGLWEPLTLALYASAAVLLFQAARERGGGSANELRLLASGFVFLVLEEVDYLGIFGGLIGRVDGVYAGALHDLVPLLARDLVPWYVMVLLIGAGALAAGLTYRRLDLSVMRLASRLRGPSGVWAAVGVLALSFALAGESSLLGISWQQPTPEELIELIGALGLAGFALIQAGPPLPRPSAH